jgi:hypothetical protein
MVRSAPEPAHAFYRFGLRREAVSLSPVDLGQHLRQILTSLPKRIDEAFTDQGLYGQFSEFFQTDDTGLNHSCTVKFSSIRLKGSPELATSVMLDHLIMVLAPFAAGLEIEGNVIPLSGDKELSFTEAADPKTSFDRVRITLRFEQFLLR